MLCDCVGRVGWLQVKSGAQADDGRSRGIWLAGHQADWQMKANATPPRNLFHTTVSLMLAKLHFEEMETTKPLGSIRSISLQSRQINWG